jgi:hypothetical protein
MTMMLHSIYVLAKHLLVHSHDYHAMPCHVRTICCIVTRCASMFTLRNKPPTTQTGGHLRAFHRHDVGWTRHEQRIGHGFLHSKELVHSTAPVTKGERINLIVKFNWKRIHPEIPYQPFHKWSMVHHTFLSLPLLITANTIFVALFICIVTIAVLGRSTICIDVFNIIGFIIISTNKSFDA